MPMPSITFDASVASLTSSSPILLLSFMVLTELIVTVMTLEHIPTDMHCNDRVAHVSVPAMILGIENAAVKAHIGHFVK
eukprot:11772395-Ditylum_brightwellii.AAC.1